MTNITELISTVLLFFATISQPPIGVDSHQTKLAVMSQLVETEGYVSLLGFNDEDSRTQKEPFVFTNVKPETIVTLISSEIEVLERKLQEPSNSRLDASLFELKVEKLLPKTSEVIATAKNHSEFLICDVSSSLSISDPAEPKTSFRSYAYSDGCVFPGESTKLVFSIIVGKQKFQKVRNFRFENGELEVTATPSRATIAFEDSIVFVDKKTLEKEISELHYFLGTEAAMKVADSALQDTLQRRKKQN